MSDVVSIDRIQTVCVLGAGTMGHGIAQVAATAGWRVVLYDLSAELVAAGRRTIEENLAKAVARGKVSQESADESLARVKTTISLPDAARGADLVIEAIPERLALKVETFATLDKIVPAATLLATNTSSLSVAKIARATARPERVLGLHFFNPVHIMKLVEVVKHEHTAAEVVDTARAVVERMGKVPIVVNDVAGFASSRLGITLGLEAMRMLEQGVASAADIDKAMTLGYGHPMGPLELTDLVGLDVRLAIAEYLETQLGPSFAPPNILREHVHKGELGKKTGQGFYLWRDGKPVK